MLPWQGKLKTTPPQRHKIEAIAKQIPPFNAIRAVGACLLFCPNMATGAAFWRSTPKGRSRERGMGNSPAVRWPCRQKSKQDPQWSSKSTWSSKADPSSLFGWTGWPLLGGGLSSQIGCGEMGRTERVEAAPRARKKQPIRLHKPRHGRV